jgi:hypothetical protein
MRGLFLLGLMAGCGGAGASTTTTAPAPMDETIRVRVGEGTIDLIRRQDVSTIELAAPRDRVWSALIAVHAALGIPAAALDAKTGTAEFVYENRRLLDGKRLSTYVECGSTMTGERADMYSVSIRLNEAVEARGPEASAVYVLVNAWARDVGVSTDPVPCTSTRALEKRIAELVTARLKT